MKGFITSLVLTIIGFIGAVNSFFVNEGIYLLSLGAIILGIILSTSVIIKYFRSK